MGVGRPGRGLRRLGIESRTVYQTLGLESLDERRTKPSVNGTCIRTLSRTTARCTRGAGRPPPAASRCALLTPGSITEVQGGRSIAPCAHVLLAGAFISRYRRAHACLYLRLRQPSERKRVHIGSDCRQPSHRLCAVACGQRWQCAVYCLRNRSHRRGREARRLFSVEWQDPGF